VKVFEVHTRTRVPRPRPEVFSFFADAGNLEVLTPPFLGFRILAPQPIEMHPGALIDYRISRHGLPMKWRTRIAVWEPPSRFVDEQLKGPYRLWIHEHTFEDAGDSKVVVDHVRYAPPFGALANRLLVAREAKTIFAYREAKLKEVFG
jgi:ligand-binding SRPBCC domain-containing protein